MNRERYLIYGAGGHARVLLDGLHKQFGEHAVQVFFNDGDEPKAIAGVPVVPYDADKHSEVSLLIGVGKPEIRERLTKKIAHCFGIFIHPNASVAADVHIGEGSVILAGAVIQSKAKVGKHTIINANVTIDHDGIVEDFVTTYPGVYVGAGAVVGKGAIINPNAVIMRLSQVAPFTEICAGQIIEG